MAIYKIKKQENFVILDKTFLNSEELSWQAKGLLAHLLGRPADWEVHISELVKRASNGEHATRSALRELQEKRYIIFIRTRKNGRYESGQYHVYNQPQASKYERILPCSENHNVEETDNNSVHFISTMMPCNSSSDIELPHVDFLDLENQSLINKDKTKKINNKEKAAANESQMCSADVKAEKEVAAAAFSDLLPEENSSLKPETTICTNLGSLATSVAAPNSSENPNILEDTIIGKSLTALQEQRLLQLAKEVQHYLMTYTLEALVEELTYEILDHSFTQCGRDFYKKVNVLRKAVISGQWQHSRRHLLQLEHKQLVQNQQFQHLKNELHSVELEINGIQQSMEQYPQFLVPFEPELKKQQEKRKQLLREISHLSPSQGV